MNRPQPYDLMRTFDDLWDMLGDELEAARRTNVLGARQHILDAFLAGAGLNQILEDHLHRDFRLVRKAANRFGRRTGRGHRVVHGALLASSAAWQWARTAGPARDLLAWQRELAGLVERLAALVAEPATIDGVGQAHRLLSGHQPRSLRDVRSQLLRLPQCYFAFDQLPDDCATLIERFIDQLAPDRDRPLAVVGLRTSGSYLAPMTTAYLHRYGFPKARSLTWRRGEPWLAQDARQLRSVAHGGGRVLLVDDPPTTGDSFLALARAVQRLGFSDDAIVILLQTFDAPASPVWQQALAPFPAVRLEWADWAIHRQLGETVSLRTAGTDACLARIGTPERQSVRGHARVLYQLKGRPPNSITGTGLVYAKGIGLGYFGRAAAETAERLQPFLPRLYGVVENIRFREWLPEADRLSGTGAGRTPHDERLLAYVEVRRRSLPLREDPSHRIAGRDAIWERAVELLAPAARRSAPLARLTLPRLLKSLLRAATPSLIDGSMQSTDWFFPSRSRARPVKVRAWGGAFWSGITYGADAAYDLAGAVVERRLQTASVGSGDQLRATWEATNGGAIPEEQWLIYQLLQLRQRWNRGASIEREMSRLLETYFGNLYLSDLRTVPSGPLCAIDIDGVLDTAWLSFPSTTPAGALSLRALTAHGYRPVLVSGRSLGEVHDRCNAYRLVGGVAEYGSAIYFCGSDARLPIDAAVLGDLEVLRTSLARAPDVTIDPGYATAVRASRIEGRRRRALLPQTESLATRMAPGAIYAVTGTAQTDFVPIGTDKARGLTALAQALAEDGPPALAVGDSWTDLPMLRMASRAVAPGNADAAVRHAVTDMRGRLTVVHRRYQAGLQEAVSHLIGHIPGGCRSCAPPRFGEYTRTFLAILAMQNASVWNEALSLARLATSRPVGTR